MLQRRPACRLLTALTTAVGAVVLAVVLPAEPAAAQGISITGPANGAVGELLVFEAQASGCAAIAGGWTWFTDGAQATGPTSTATIQLSWAEPGIKGVSAVNLGCGGAQGSASVEIFDSGRIELVGSAAAFAENAGTVTLAARRTGGSVGAASARFTSADETATAGADYQSSTGLLTWADGETGDRLLSLTLFDDLAYEGDETFLVSLSDPQGGAQLGAVRETRVTLLEDDPPPGDVVRFAQSRFTSDEEADFASVVVTRGSALAGEISVQFTTEELSATPGADYEETTLTLTWADGDVAPREVLVPLIGDSLVEGEESVDLVLFDPSPGAFLGEPAFAELALLDDDAAAGSLQFVTTSRSISEADGTVTFEVSRTGGAAGAVGVSVVRLGGSAGPEDATLLTESLAWQDGDDSDRQVEIVVLDDEQPEGTENLIVGLSAATGGAVLGSSSQAELEIVDDDSASVSLLAFADAGRSVGESSGSVTVTVVRSGSLATPASARAITQDLSASAGLDYVAIDRALAWPAGDGTARSFNVTLLDDDLVEGDELFEVILTDLEDAGLGAPSAMSVEIVDDDVGLSQIRFASGAVEVGEADGELDLVVRRTGSLELDASVRVTGQPATASVPADFLAPSQTLEWEAGDGSDRIYTVTLVDDQLVEGSESFVVRLDQFVNSQPGSPAQVTVELLDDDTPPAGAIGFAASSYTASEADASIDFELVRSGGDSGTASVLLEIVPVEAQPGSDYLTPQSLQLDWDDGEDGSRTFAVPLVDDDRIEPLETLRTRIVATSGAALGARRVATGTVFDDDLAFGLCPDGQPLALCLNQERFAVEVSFRTAGGVSGEGRPIGLTTDSGYFWFFEADNVEIFLKVLDGCSINQNYWVFVTGLTDVEVELTVTDRISGASKDFSSPLGTPFEPVLDTAAFPFCDEAGAASTTSSRHRPDDPSRRSHRASAVLGATAALAPTPSCPPGAPDDLLCLVEGRFEIAVDWNSDLAAGPGRPLELTRDTGTFWFFEPDNLELLVKVLDGCSINQHRWVFAGGLTDVATRMVVTDTADGTERIYESPLGPPYEPVLDIEAFDCE